MKKKEISLLYIELTTSCNSKCKYCDYWKVNPKFMNLDLLERIELNFKNKSVSNLIFTGGEPLLHPNFSNIVNKIKNIIQPKICTLMTNGLLLQKYDKSIANFFDRIVISMDGFNRQSYKETRGVDGFQTVLENINIFKKNHMGVEIRVKVTLHPKFISFIPDFIDIAKNNSIDKISFNALDTTTENAYSRMKINKRDIEKYKIKEINKVIFELQSKEKLEILIDDVNTLKKTLSRNINKHLSFPKCNALTNTNIIHTNGDIRLCFFTKIVGNLYSNDLNNILESTQVKEMKEQFKIEKLKECLTCLAPYCIEEEGDMPYRT